MPVSSFLYQNKSIQTNAQLFQAFVFGGTPTAPTTETSKNFIFRPPEKCGAGNRALICCTYETGTAPTISDTAGNSWPVTPTGIVTSGGNNTAIWDLKNIVGGVLNVITITFGSAVQTPSTEYWEFSGLSTSVANGGIHSTSALIAPNLTTGSFTPSPNNDSNGGYLICAFFHDSGGNDAGPTDWLPGGSFTLMQGDSMVNGNFAQGQPMASEYFVFSNGAGITPINPSMTANNDSSTHYNCITIALPLSPGAGTPPPSQLRINKVIKQRTPNVSGATTIKSNVPVIGNLTVICNTEDNNFNSAISDSGGSYLLASNNTFPAIYYLNNKGPRSPNLTNFTMSGVSSNFDIWVFDISGANTGTVVGAVASAGVTTTTGAQTLVSDQPDITPTSVNSLVINAITNGNGPTLIAGPPSGAITINVSMDIPGESDGGVNSGDEVAIIHNTSLTTQHWGWTIVPPGQQSGVASSAVEFLK